MSSTIVAQRAVVDGRITPAVIAIRDGRIASIDTDADMVAAAGSTLPDSAPANVVVLDDAELLLPGGVDTHVHLNEPGRTEWEGFATGTRAAAAGGVTTVVDMPLNSVPSTITPEALAAKRAAAQGKLSVDLGYWGGAVPQNLGHLEALWNEGVFGFKCFTLPSGVDEFEPLDADQFNRAMAEIAGFDGRMIVHAEDQRTIEAAPHQGSRAYRDFLLSRPDDAELAAIAQVIDAVREHGTRTHLLHLSSARALDMIAAARAEGLPLSVETCPHYLCLDAGTIPDAAPEFKCCPPIRDRGNQEALWQGLLDGIIDIIVTDHSPSTLEQKLKGDGDLQQAWGGIAGVQVGYSAILDAAASRGIGAERVAEWMSVRPAELMQVPGKGGIVAGHDADLAVWTPGSRRVSLAELHHRNPISAWDGRELSGRISRVWLRGTELTGVQTGGRELFRG